MHNLDFSVSSSSTLNTWTGGDRDQNTNPAINGWPTLPPELQPPCSSGLSLLPSSHPCLTRLLSLSHLAPSFVPPLLQSLDVIYLVHLDLKGFCRGGRAPEVRGSWGPQWAIYPARTWAGGGGRRGSDCLFGGAVRRWGGGRVQGKCWDQTTALEAWKNKYEEDNKKRVLNTPRVHHKVFPDRETHLVLYTVSLKHSYSFIYLAWIIPFILLI